MVLPPPQPPQTLFEWRQSWPRWYGTPEDVAAAARKIDDEARGNFIPSHFSVHRDLAWGTAEQVAGGTADRVAGSATVDAFAIDLSVNRRHLLAVHVRVLVIDRSWSYPLDIENWPTVPFVQPTAVAVESHKAPLLVRLDLTPERGAELIVLSASGLNGDTLFTAIKPYVAHGAGRVPHTGLYRGPIPWLLPRFELTDGQRRWLRVATVVGSIVGALGGVAGIAALLIA